MSRQPSASEYDAVVSSLAAALRPLAGLADAYEANDLEDPQPVWRRGLAVDEKSVLVENKGGSSLLRLGDAFAAREALAHADRLRSTVEKGQPDD